MQDKETHMKVLTETRACTIGGYWKIINQASRHGWSKVVEEMKQANEFLASEALDWMMAQGIEPEQVTYDHNPDWYIRGKGGE